MRAVVMRRHGGPDVLVIEDVPAPEPGPGEAVVRLRAAALNHLDVWVRRGGRAPAPAGPQVLGSDGAGVVSALGPGACGMAVGQEVVVNPGLACGTCELCRGGQQSLCVDFGIIGMSRAGTFAEQVAVPAANLAPKPAHLSFAEAAALTLAHTTAWRMLMTRAGLQPGETVLIHGIGGGVALAALQIARLVCARAIVTSSSDEKLDRARALGADETINYRATPDVAGRVRDLTNRRGVDVAVDTVGAATWPIDLAALRRGGRVVVCGVTSGAEASTDLRALYWNQLTALGSTLGSDQDFRAMLRAVSAARMKPVIDCVLPLEQARAAAERMERGQQFGKIVLDIR